VPAYNTRVVFPSPPTGQVMAGATTVQITMLGGPAGPQGPQGIPGPAGPPSMSKAQVTSYQIALG